MANRWTKEQWAAITTRGCDILVAAAAGSGKTAVLVERIIMMVTEGPNPIDIDRLLVVTFTNAAASEMRQRIGEAIQQKMEENPLDSHLQRQSILLNRAKITTIHAFCLEVIRENYMDVDIDPSFRIADEAETALMKSELIEELFEEKYASEDNAGFLALVESYGENTRDTRLRDLVFTVHSFVQSSPFPDRWIDEMCGRFYIGAEKPLEETLWGTMLTEETAFELNGLLSLSKRALAVIDEPDGPLEYREAVVSDIALLSGLSDILQKGLEDFHQALFSVGFAKLGRKKKDSSEEKIERVKALREEVKDGLKGIKEKLFFKTPEKLKEDILHLMPVITSLGSLIKEFGARYQSAKRDKMLVDFNDLEHYCLQILLAEGSTEKNPIPSKAALTLQERFEEILTDEYQDSNLVQEMILSVISRGSRERHNRFMVGDVKQSIYRFRLARPEIFMEKYETYPLTKNGASVRIDLFQNFRSRAEVLNGINFLFRQLMTKDLGEVTYDENASLHPGASFPEIQEGMEAGGATEVCLIDTRKEERDEESSVSEDGEEIEDISAMELEVLYIGGRIREFIDSGFQVADRETGGYRRVTYRDIVVLLRASNTWADLFVDKFMDMGIPAFAESVSGYFDTAEVMTVLNLLYVIDNPVNDIPLIASLRSPIYRLGSEELAKIRLKRAEGSFYDCVLSYRAEEEDSTADKLMKFLEDLELWRTLAVTLPVDELIWDIYNRTGYFDYVGVTPAGNIRQANLRFLLDKAVKYETTSFKGLFHFIKYIEKVQQNKTDIGSAKVLSENENLVRIMSIHKSKGLEFPVVFVSGLGKRFNKRDMTKPVLLHPDLGFGPVYVDYEMRVTYQTIAKSLIARRIQKENLSEEMRILYVALTRAKEKLVLTGAVRNMDNALSKWAMYAGDSKTELPYYDMCQGNSFFDWIMPALARHRDGKVLRGDGETAGTGSAALYSDASRWDIKRISVEDIASHLQNERKKEEAAKNSIEDLQADRDYSGHREEIRKKLSFVYPYETETTFPANISISEIKRLFYEERELPSRETQNKRAEETIRFQQPAFLEEKKGLSGARKGTAVHTVLERLDFKKNYAYEDIKNEIAGLVAGNILSEEEGKSVPIRKVLRFFNSDLGKRLYEADRIYKETPFVLAMSPWEIYKREEFRQSGEKILVHGIVDCFFYENDRIILLDYKTDYVEEGQEDKIKDRYGIQLSIYKKALEEILETEVSESYIYLFGLDEAVRI